MLLHSAKQGLLLRKIGKRKDEIRGWMVSNAVPITGIVYRETRDFETYDQAVKAKGYKPINPGDWWGGGVNAWFKFTVQIPKSFKGRRVAARLSLGGESCAFINGTPYQGLDGNHEEMLLTPCAKGNEKIDIVIDSTSYFWHSPHDTSKRKFYMADLITINPEVREYWFNLEVLHLLAEQLPQESPRRAKIIYTLSKSVDAFDYTHTDDESLKKSALAANAILKPLLNNRANASATNVAVHGHSHIDTAWLWPYRETKRKCARTFSTVMRLMEQYPEYIFTQSQGQLYEFTKENYPELYEEIKKRVKEGRWEVQGSMWVEADCNLSSGESLIRQVLVAKNFFKDEFDVETDVLWLPDVFGYSAALPQILQKSRVPYFSTIKINWSQFNRFPYTTFWWTGIDGTKVLAHFPPSGDYNAYPDPGKLRAQVHDFKEKDRSDESLMSYGWGDGGGGADIRHLELLSRSKDLEGLPRCTQKKVTDFFHSIDQPIDYPEWVGELYLELHRGTYTTQARNKRYNRKCELLYRDAELLSSIAVGMGVRYPYEDLHREWKRILCNQFHDVIPGSSIRLVYEDTDVMYPEILAAGEKAVNRALDAIVKNIDTSGDGEAIVVFNTLPWERADVVSVKAPKTSEAIVVDGSGKTIASQVTDDKITFTASVPPMGYTVYRLKDSPSSKAANSLKASRSGLENRFYKIGLDAKGVIKSIIHKETGRETLPAGTRANLLQLFEDKPLDWPAWDIDFFYDDKWQDVTSVDKIEVVEQGPVSAAIEITRSFSASKVKQRIVIYADNPRIDFRTWVDWYEKDKCLKASFPVDVNASKARYEIQFGNTERPTHTNTSWDAARFEVCAHKWADLSEQGFGVSLLNDCKYGHHTKGNVMRLTLLRSPKDPDPLADMGQHEFTYSLLPHGGDYIQAGTVREAYGLNVPMRAVSAKAARGSLPARKSFFSVDAGNVILETVKKAEKENAVIVRVYECHNQRATVTIAADVPFKKVTECDLLETDIAEIASIEGSFSFDIKPFEIKTFKLR